jgi:dTDP-4-dehydrorhamnose 3,5-epimerase
METYARSDFEKAGITGSIVQQNHSKSARGVLRGLHFQKEPYSQAKLVRCVRGEILDVAVDMRPDSSTLGNHVAIRLSETNKRMLFVPRSFAHGFLVTSDVAEVEYSVDNIYAPTHEGGVIWNDPQIRIQWPIADPILSDKDKKWSTLADLMKE